MENNVIKKIINASHVNNYDEMSISEFKKNIKILSISDLRDLRYEYLQKIRKLETFIKSNGINWEDFKKLYKIKKSKLIKLNHINLTWDNEISQKEKDNENK